MTCQEGRIEHCGHVTTVRYSEQQAMTTSNGAVKNAAVEATASPAGPGPAGPVAVAATVSSNFDLYAGEFACDDEISFENLLQLDNDIDKPPPPPPASTSVPQPPIPTPAAAVVCRQPVLQQAPAIVPGTPAQSPTPAGVPADTVVYLLSTAALRPPPPGSGPGADAAAAGVLDAAMTPPRNDVRPLLRFQIAKRPTAGALVAGYGLELQAAGPSVVPGTGLGAPPPTVVELSSVGDAGCASSSERRLAFNGDLATQPGRSLVVAAGTPRPPASKCAVAPPASGSTKSSKSSSSADARQTVQEKNAWLLYGTQVLGHGGLGSCGVEAWSRRRTRTSTSA